MTNHRDVHSACIMAAALSRRRALRGLAGAAGLGLVGGSRRARVAAESHVATRYIGLAFGAIFPPDLPDSDDFGLHGGVTYHGVDGGLAAGALTQPVVAAFGPAAERLVGGCSTALAPLDGSRDQWAQTEFWQFQTSDDARAVREIFATPGPNVTKLPGGSDRGDFLAALTPQSGGTNIDARYVVFSFQEIAGRITRGWQYAADATAPDAEASTALLEDLRKVAVRRLTTLTDPDNDGLATTVPTFPELEVATIGGFPSPVSNWIDLVTIVDGVAIRRIFQTEEEYERFLQNHTDAQDAFTRIQQVTTFGGNPLLVQVDAVRHDREEAAEAYFDGAADRVAEEVAAKTDYESQLIDPPSGQNDDRPSQWFENRLTNGDAQTLGVSGVLLNGRDVAVIAVAGGPRPPEQNDDPAYAAGLQDFGALGIELYRAWNDPDLRSDPNFLAELTPELAEYCQAWDELVAALDAR